MTPEESARYDRAEEALGRYPGVVGVGYGLKEVGGEVTDEVAFRVYVRQKKPAADLSPEETIPAEFEGVPTDVLKVRRVSFSAVDTERHSPLIGGITITNFKGPANSLKLGTLGCFASLDGVSAKENVVALTNNHVLAAHSGAVGDPCYQPSRLNPTTVDENDRGPFGEVTNLGKKEEHPFTYPGEAEHDYYVDCAMVKLNICISSWCNTNCGIDYKNSLREIDISGSSQIKGVARAAKDDVVFMSGCESGGTKGKVSDASAPVELENGDIVHRVIEIVPVDPPQTFSVEGDSGAAVVNDKGEIVGLLFGDNRDVGAAARSHACHIHPVMDVLKVTPISTANPPVPPAGKARSDVRGFLGDGVNETVALRRRLAATPRGAEIMARVETHRGEVVSLVNHRRPVTVAWHRAQGPAFLAHALENARNPAHSIPFEIEEVGRRALLERMAEVLTAHGSRGLAAAIAAHREEVLALAGGFEDLHELVGRFAGSPGEGRPGEGMLVDG